MLPGNVDPRRPEKVQRYVPKTNGTPQEPDLTTDYMNILGQHPTTANAPEAADKHAESSVGTEPNPQVHSALEEVQQQVNDELVIAASMIPTSPQYGVTIIPNVPTNLTDLPADIVTAPTEIVTDASIKPPDDNKELHSTPSRNDRFKVVKIASLEPFKRGRWKCMDYVDEPPVSQSKVAQSAGSIQVASGVYLQTQSLPQQQIQQMLLQSGFTNGTQFFSNVPQMLPPGQYFYPQVANIQNQTLQQQVPSSMPAQFINSGQPYFPAGVIQNATGFTIPPGYQNMQYIPANLIQNQNSAFVPTSQTVQLPTNFQQSQTYAGQPNVSQANVAPQQPLVNGHSYPPQNEQQVTASSLPTQTAKSVILNSNVPQPVVSQNQITQQQQQNVQSHMPVQNSTQSVSALQNQQQYQQNAFQQPVPNQQQQQQQSQSQPTNAVQSSTVVQGPAIIQVSQMMPQQNFDPSMANNVYTNPQFTMSVNSLTALDNNEASGEAMNEAIGGTEAATESTDDLAKTNPVVNAIDNKIEQAMDLVKSHLMYTVREEVEVLKEKITDLLDRIQQLENENNFLRSQIPKSQNTTSTPTTSNANPTNINTTSQSSVPITSPNLIPPNQPNSQTAAPAVVNPSPNPVTNTQNPPQKTSNEPAAQQ